MELSISPYLLSASHLGQLQHREKSNPSQGDWFENPNCELMLGRVSSRHLSTSLTSSGSFPIREVTFHVLIAGFHNQGSDCQGPAFDGHLIHIAPDRYGSSCGWWAHLREAPCFHFGLSLTGPHGKRACHQAVTHKPLPGASPSPCYNLPS